MGSASLFRRLTSRARVLEGGAPPAEVQPEPQLDDWLAHYFDDRLSEIDEVCGGAGPEAYKLFRDLDDDLWTLLLSREYERYPNIRALLPDLPAPELQLRWNGASGLRLLGQSRAFYTKAKQRFSLASTTDLAASRVLDFGCGWGRLTRFFARDVEPGSLFGCDPVDEILRLCRELRVPATLARSDFVPISLPFDGGFDLVFAFSVFTHLSEAAHERCLHAIHDSLDPGGLLVLTVRSPAYLGLSEPMHGLLRSLGPDHLTALDEPRFLFVSHDAEPDHPQYQGRDMTYGETVISLPYIRERWSRLFDLLEVDLLTEDLHQVMLTLRRRR